jgi:hypothetical protein
MCVRARRALDAQQARSPRIVHRQWCGAWRWHDSLGAVILAGKHEGRVGGASRKVWGRGNSPSSAVAVRR